MSRFNPKYNFVLKQEALRVCTFSRVMKEKGIGDAITAVCSVNSILGFNAFRLDVYGKVDGDQVEWFDSLIRNVPGYINYKGLVPYDETTKIIKNYFALLFPTYYDGEGFAGTLIDALAAGVPVIASDWKYNSELVVDKVTGIIFETRNTDDLIKKLLWVYEHQIVWNNMKEQCLHRAFDYIPKKALVPLLTNFS